MILVISIKQQEFDNKKWNSRIERANQTGMIKIPHFEQLGNGNFQPSLRTGYFESRRRETNIDEDTSYM